MTVELATVKRGDMTEQITVVGNLIGAATVEAVPKVSGRLEDVYVRLGDRVTRGQRLAKIEDREMLEQVKQAEASYEVSAATIRQREADLQAGADQPRTLAQPLRAPAASEADLRRHRRALSGGGGAARSRQGAVSRRRRRGSTS